MQSDLIKIAHQLIATANQLIQAAGNQTDTIEYVATPIEIDEEAFVDLDKPSKHSQFTDRSEKIKSLQSQLDIWNKKLINAKTDDGRREARTMIGTYKGHLTKAMNSTTAGKKETRWKSQV